MRQQEFFDEVKALDIPKAEEYLEEVSEALEDYFIDQERPVEDQRVDENFAETLGREFSDHEMQVTAQLLNSQMDEIDAGEYFEWLEFYRDTSLERTQSEEWITQYDLESIERFAEQVRENIENADPVVTIIDSAFIPVYERDYQH